MNGQKNYIGKALLYGGAALFALNTLYSCSGCSPSGRANRMNLDYIGTIGNQHINAEKNAYEYQINTSNLKKPLKIEYHDYQNDMELDEVYIEFADANGRTQKSWPEKGTRLFEAADSSYKALRKGIAEKKNDIQKNREQKNIDNFFK